MKVCKVTCNYRGQGYLLFKQGKGNEALNVYKILLENMWEEKIYSYKKVEKVVKEIFNFSTDFLNVELILFLSNLDVAPKLYSERVRIVNKIFQIWKSFDYQVFFSYLKKLNSYENFLANPDLIKIFLKKLSKDSYLKDKRIEYVIK